MICGFSVSVVILFQHPVSCDLFPTFIESQRQRNSLNFKCNCFLIYLSNIASLKERFSYKRRGKVVTKEFV